MKINVAWILRVLISVFALAVSLPLAMAGPPLICHSFTIGNAKSLPWGAAEKNWFAPAGDYDTKHLVDDTVALLGDHTPVIVRMETIRRAALYASGDLSLGKALLDRVRTLADKQEKPGALHLFDYGYLIETMRQGATMKPLENLSRLVDGMEGYPLIREALQLSADNPEMEFAAAVVTLWPKNSEHQGHFRKAVSGAVDDSLLAANLLSRFPDRGRTLADLRSY